MAQRRFLWILLLVVSPFRPEPLADARPWDADNNPPTINVGILLPNDSSFPYSLSRVVPGIRIALGSDRMKELLPGSNATVKMMDSECSQVTGPIEAMRAIYNGPLDLLLGPNCDYAAAPVARYNMVWKRCMISSGCGAPGFENKDNMLLTRILLNFNTAGFALGKVMTDEFQWRHVVLLTENDRNDPTKKDCYFTNMGVGMHFRDYVKVPESIQITPREFPNYTRILSERVAPYARVVIICASGDAVRKLMLAAHRLGMTDGSYAFFNIVLFDSTYFGNIGWKRDDEHDEEAKAAYRALMTFTLHNKKTPQYEEFALEVKERAMAEFNFSYDSIGEEVNSFVGAFHDAVLLYAMALNETLDDPEGDPRDGASVTRRMWNRTFTGISGEISIDEKGDRDADYSLLEMTDTENGTFEVIGVYYGAKRVYKPVAGKVIDWPGSEVPPDIPKCGFLNELCPPPNNSPTTLLIMGSMAVIILSAVGIILYVLRKYRLERELSNMSWRIRWEDISFNNKGDKMRKLGGSRMSFGSGNTQDSGQSVWGNNQQIFTVTGFYKGIVIAIKRVNRQRVELNRNVLMEIKYVRDLQHDHVIKFIGACIDAPNISIMTEYCPKGSLQDILENESIELDELFKYSLMYDIVKGMIYLHSSVICTHGNLKSSNCVVDSRFVLKITDFGLNSFREPDHPFEPTEEDSYKYYQRRLWTAPELLRLPEIPTGGTQKGDVYSFGIILQEIMYREGVFYIKDVDLMPEEIVKKVANGYKPPFRPTIDRVTCSQEMMDLIRDCWAEDPADRTDFRELRGIMRKLNKNSENKGLVDTLLSRMEQYASNLESLVQERTEAFYEEKRKAEELLYQILPRPIAEELKNGKPVTAESFECVTIYFSDIVGFTKLSSDSTPLEVVDLLNDLYTCFDAIIDNFNVYKVETIGDAYMVVSGLPIRNGDFHAREIARMSLALLNEITTFRIRHRPDERLRLRIGVHTGPVVAGVVGLKMPRYCLFGDTVNTASRMESNGEAMKIHISEHTKKILDLFGTFVLELRGEVEMKGKGKQTTYWLKGELKGQNGICDLKYQEITV
ncbi:atrial natriuretic peptide receptor 1-like isoform X3 [Diadema antillarum]|uniref:atrial natriuretic peptide receptor 1-like isoform X3 n=1 Tax=Diadema antillarum TaxID=105358 RepID=UPI003A8B22AC